MAAPRQPQDRQAAKPRTRAVQRKPTAAEMAAVDAERIEAEAEALDAGEWVTAPLPTGDTVRVMPFLEWPRRTYRAIVRGGDFESVADVIHDDDLAAFDGWDSNIGDLINWVTELIVDSGQEVGESGASNRSSRRARRR
jgi:hypothetical protein